MIDSKISLSPAQSPDQESPDQVTEAFAERLMDELFDGVERALEGDDSALESLMTERPEIAPIALSETAELTLSFSEGGLPAVLLAAGDEHAIAPFASVSSEDAAAPVAPSSPKPSPWTWNRFLWGATGLTLLATLGLWFYQRQQALTLGTVATTTVVPEATTTAPHAEFLEYLRRSLEVIAQNSPNADAPTVATLPPGAIAPGSNGLGLPSVGNPTFSIQPSPGAIASGSNPVSVIERVYIPYPTSQAPSLPAGTVAPSTTAAAAPNTPATTAPPAPLVTSLQHKLVGVLELGDRSAALFEVDGVPQRVYIGERIASSGWSLVSVANNEVMIRRNGEVRTLYIGQQF